MRRLSFAVPGDLATPTGGYGYDRRMIAELRTLGWQVDVIGLGDGFPRPTAQQKAHAHDCLAQTTAGDPIVIDGLAFGVLPEAAADLRGNNPLVALVHHPLALETGVPDTDVPLLRTSERDALSATRAVVVTSPSTARVLVADYGVAPDRITVAPPGTDRGAVAPGSDDGVVRLISVGAIVPRKGFDVLLAALATMKDLPWTLIIAGDRGRDPAAVARLDADIARFDLGDRVSTRGAMPAEQLAALYAGSDIFVLASHFEGYGMAYAEAIAHGLPVIGTTAGAIPDTVPAGTGILVPPGDAAALAAALRRLIADAAERRRLATASREAASRLPTWADSAKLFARAIEAVT